MGTWTFTVATGIAAWERPADSKTGKRYTPKKVIDSETWIGWAARAAGVPSLGKARVGLAVLLPIGTLGDVDNRVKTVMDALQKANIIDNDNQVDSLSVERNLPRRASPVVTVYELTSPSRGGEAPRRRRSAQRQQGASA